ncbi:MAG TPA: 4'-phosphopantetheinyl transferase superfamily protein [Candidatus Hydrogenedentes bacterium]|mgnify:CR=1 FL=1|nr:4'-phosphopantetheinyl transferase superfamily protein [Candidatus Hydrogenedentota bacterium]
MPLQIIFSHFRVVFTKSGLNAKVKREDPLPLEIREFHPGIFGCWVCWPCARPDAAVLTGEERARLARVGNPEVRQRRAVGWYVLRRLTATVCGVAMEDLEAAGEPGLVFRNDVSRAWYGSISHSGSVICAVVSARVIPGVDVEEIRPRKNVNALAERFFTKKEADWVREAKFPGTDLSDDEVTRFLRLWTRREAIVKALGLGVLNGFSRFAAPAVARLSEPVRVRLLGRGTGTAHAWTRDLLDVPDGLLAALAWRSREG